MVASSAWTMAVRLAPTMPIARAASSSSTFLNRFIFVASSLNYLGGPLSPLPQCPQQGCAQVRSAGWRAAERLPEDLGDLPPDGRVARPEVRPVLPVARLA